MTKTLTILLITLLLIITGIGMYIFRINPLLFLEKTFAYPIYLVRSADFSTPISTEPDKPEPFPSNLPTTVKPTEAYTIILVGNSMTDFLGDNPTKLREYLKVH